MSALVPDPAASSAPAVAGTFATPRQLLEAADHTERNHKPVSNDILGFVTSDSRYTQRASNDRFVPIYLSRQGFRYLTKVVPSLADSEETIKDVLETEKEFTAMVVHTTDREVHHKPTVAVLMDKNYNLFKCIFPNTHGKYVARLVPGDIVECVEFDYFTVLLSVEQCDAAPIRPVVYIHKYETKQRFNKCNLPKLCIHDVSEAEDGSDSEPEDSSDSETEKNCRDYSSDDYKDRFLDYTSEDECRYRAERNYYCYYGRRWIGFPFRFITQAYKTGECIFSKDGNHGGIPLLEIEEWSRQHLETKGIVGATVHAVVGEISEADNRFEVSLFKAELRDVTKVADTLDRHQKDLCSCLQSCQVAGCLADVLKPTTIRGFASSSTPDLRALVNMEPSTYWNWYSENVDFIDALSYDRRENACLYRAIRELANDGKAGTAVNLEE